MRIVHVSDCFAPRTGGIETQVGALAARQRDAGHEVRVITATAGPSVWEGIPVDRVTARIPFELPLHPRTRAHVLPAVRAAEPDVVHVHVGAVSPFAWGALRAVREAGLPALITVHSIWGPLARPGYRLAHLLTRWAGWARVSAVSEIAAGLVERAVPQAAPVLVLPNGIDPAVWQVEPGAPEPGALRLVAVMRLAPRKRTAALLRIVDEAAAMSDARIELALVGDGPDRGRAERAARTSRARVRVLGRLDAPGVRAQLAAADAFIQPSIRESFGIAALEARTAGLPVIARSQSGTATFIEEGVSGLLAADDAGLAHAIVRLAGEPALLARMARNNREHVPAQSWPAILSAVDAAYAEARTQRAARPLR